jgi:hypothetical protein
MIDFGFVISGFVPLVSIYMFFSELSDIEYIYLTRTSGFVLDVSYRLSVMSG